MEMKKESLQIGLALELKFANKIWQILGMQFFKKFEDLDLNEGTDFAIFTAKPVRVAVRIRRYKYYKCRRYRKQFTIRWKLCSGHKTEIDKIREGLVDYIFYAFIDEAESKFLQYFIGDLNVFRKVNAEPMEIRPNKDKSSELAAFYVNQFPGNFILKKWFI